MKARLNLSKTGASSKSILIVDDHPDIRFLLKKYLLKTLPHVAVIEADSGLVASAKLRMGDIGLVVSDVQMPNGDDFWLHCFMREYYETTPVIFFTSEPEAIAKVQGEPLRAVIAKMDMQSLHAALKEFWEENESP